MITLQVLGMGCQKCQVLADRTEQAARELGLEFQIEKVTDVERISKFGIMSTPALAVDGEVKVVGRVPTVGALKVILG